CSGLPLYALLLLLPDATRPEFHMSAFFSSSLSGLVATSICHADCTTPLSVALIHQPIRGLVVSMPYGVTLCSQLSRCGKKLPLTMNPYTSRAHSRDSFL